MSLLDRYVYILERPGGETEFLLHRELIGQKEFADLVAEAVEGHSTLLDIAVYLSFNYGFERVQRGQSARVPNAVPEKGRVG